MMARLYHRRLAWIAGLAALAWAATGFLHPIMSWTAPRPALQTPPAQLVSAIDLPAPGPLFSAAGLEAANLVRLAEVEGRRIWIARTADGFSAYDAEAGVAAPEALASHVEALARHYSGGAGAPVRSVSPVRSFNAEYPSVNRLLPVMRIELADGLAFYVDPATDRLGAVTNGPRRVMLAIFQHVHTLKFLEPVEPLRVGLIALLLGTALVSAGFGAAMLVRSMARSARGPHANGAEPARPRPVRASLMRVHRWIAFLAAPALVMFAATGLFHLFVLSGAPGPEPTPSFDPRALGAPQLERLPRTLPGLTATPAGQEAIWRAAPEAGRTGLYFAADGTPLAMTDDARARQLAGAAEGGAISVVGFFGPEYGFVNKRLPVLRVERPDGPVFVDLSEGLVAGRAPPKGLSAAEAWTFDTLHKFSWLDGLGRMLRDAISMAAAGLVLAVGGLGLVLTRRRSPSR